MAIDRSTASSVGTVIGATIGSAIPIVGTLVGGTVGGFIGGLFGDDPAEENAQLQYDYDMANYAIQSEYHDTLLGFRDEQLSYSSELQGFAYEQLAYSHAVYGVALANRQAEVVFREKEVYNKKLAAKTEFNAQADVAVLMKEGAQDSMINAIGETMRVGSNNLRDLKRKSVKAQGDTLARVGAGITGGASANRQLIAVHMEKNRETAKIREQMSTNIIKTNNAKNTMISNYNLKIGESYRNLTAMLRLEAQPVPNVNPPTPVFTGLQPVAPVAPLEAAPVQGVVGSSYLGDTMQGIATGVDIYNTFKGE